MSYLGYREKSAEWVKWEHAWQRGEATSEQGHRGSQWHPTPFHMGLWERPPESDHKGLMYCEQELGIGSWGFINGRITRFDFRMASLAWLVAGVVTLEFLSEQKEAWIQS